MRFSLVTVHCGQISQLSRIKSLYLHYNPFMVNISPLIGTLSGLKDLNITHCPSLKTPPLEIVKRGTEAVSAYLKRLQSGFTECHRTKLMFVGLGGSGKTRVAGLLLSHLMINIYCAV